SANGRLPPGAVQGPFAPAGVPEGASYSLWPLLLPYLEQAPLAARYRLDLPFDHPDNQPAVTVRLKVLECQSAAGAGPPAGGGAWHGAAADYAPLEVNPFLADLGLIDPVGNFQGPLPVNGMVRMTDIADGTSQTILLAEASGRPGVAWSSPEV